MKKQKPQDELLHHNFDGIEEFDNDLPGWWKNLFYICILFAVVYFAYYHVFGIGDSSRVEYLKEINPQYSPALAEAGGLMTAYHSPFFARDENLSPRVRAELQKIADAPFDEALMRAMAKADPAQLAKLQQAFPAVYQRYVTGGLPAAGAGASSAPEPTIAEPLKDAKALATGKQIFETQCFTCHGKLGEGGIGPNMTDEYWIHGGTIGNVITTIRKGVPAKGMISWEKTLTPDQVNAVASFILLKLQGTTPPNPKPPQGEKAAK
jgi:mono/diheme cytochrome c family protein